MSPVRMTGLAVLFSGLAFAAIVSFPSGSGSGPGTVATTATGAASADPVTAATAAGRTGGGGGAGAQPDAPQPHIVVFREPALAAYEGGTPGLAAPEPAYHGVVYTEAFGPAAFIARARTVALRNTGSALSPFNAFLIAQGLETLKLRMERHCANTQAVAEYLDRHPSVAWVSYAGLPEHRDHELAQKYLGGTASGILTFGLEGGYDAGVKAYDAFRIFKRLVNIGDAKSLACHPASTTHRQLGPEALVEAGAGPDVVRVSVGIEHIDDIIGDLEQALSAA